MNKLFLFVSFFIATCSFSQPISYTVANAHSHNDYEQPVPLFTAYNEGFGSIEADLFWHNNELLVAHTKNELALHRTLEELYLKPIQAFIEKSNGHIYADSSRRLQLMIDIKTEAVTTLNKLVELLQKYPLLTQCSSLQIAISGNRPDSTTYTSYPAFINFDGEIQKEYPAAALSRIVMMSGDLKSYTGWNGKGIIPAPQRDTLQRLISRAHGLNKPVRFWGAPDFINAWYQLIHLQVDYINTDSIKAIADFLRKLPASSYKNKTSYKPYQPTYQHDGADKPVKNILLFIGDGTGLAQLYAGYTANKGALNVFNMRSIGFSKTSSYDNYVTDSAPGSTALASGVKTNNRHVGVDHTGVAIPLLPVFLKTRNIKTGLVTCGDITDATPADFYAHQPERDSSVAILRDLKRSGVDMLMGSAKRIVSNSSLLKEFSPPFSVVQSIDSVTADPAKKWIVIDNKAGLPALKGRENWLEQAFSKAVKTLSNNKAGFFLMTEGAQIDHGGHTNNMSYVASEVMDFDQVIGKALQFADADGQTLVIVTADHETGGLSLLAGDYGDGYVSGVFSTNDHTAIPVPVFAYGPQSFRFRGVYENTALFYKMMEALKVPLKK
ncbi:alkaline phosphatase [Niastella caeni]|uniref:Alkaline phosphatase n=1 Tax=Niastella caeni TaxID=2569763 RepID=A0A4S8I1S4_9BACT|nr:alkaline phosphatase [Niastella caeni]THU39672.1 alkaline phosphatase [Niastella caeni]